MERNIYIYIKVKYSLYLPGVAQRVGRGIALLFHDRGTRKGWVVSNTPRPHFTAGIDPVPILQKTGWTPGPVWTGGNSRPHRDSIPNRPGRSSVAIPTELPAHINIGVLQLSIFVRRRKCENIRSTHLIPLWRDAVSLDECFPDASVKPAGSW